MNNARCSTGVCVRGLREWAIEEPSQLHSAKRGRVATCFKVKPLCCRLADGGSRRVLTWLSRAFYPTKLVMVGWLVGNTHTKIVMGSGT